VNLALVSGRVAECLLPLQTGSPLQAVPVTGELHRTARKLQSNVFLTPIRVANPDGHGLLGLAPAFLLMLVFEVLLQVISSSRSIFGILALDYMGGKGFERDHALLLALEP
jgi:hypothetical protein